jgi:hypothetical protein
MVPVPKTLAPLQQQAVGDFTQIADTFADMQLAISDPLRSASGIQRYQQLLSEAGRVFTNIAQSLNTSGILFSKDEPGSNWSAFLRSP